MNEKTVRTVEGAWIFGQPHPAAEDEAKNQLRVLVSNHGKTPGLEYCADEPDGEPSYQTDEPKSVWPSGPKDTPWTLPHRFPWSGTDRFAKGFVIYRDAWGKMKRSRFCYDILCGEIRPAGSPAHNSFREEDSEA